MRLAEIEIVKLFPQHVVHGGALDQPKEKSTITAIGRNPMYENKVKSALRQGRASIGTFMFEFDSTGIARIAADAGAEFALFDMEHTGWSVETIRRLIATSRSAEIVPMVRVPAAEYHFIARVLDMGARVVMVPMVGSAEQAHTIVQSAK